MSPTVKCECGRYVTARGMANHQRGQEHECLLTSVRAANRGHVYRCGPLKAEVARRLARAGFRSHFTLVKKYHAGGPGRRSKVTSSVMASERVQPVLDAFTVAWGDSPDLHAASLGAALVMHLLHGDNAHEVLIDVVTAELQDPHAGFIFEGSNLPGLTEIGLIAVLRANGVPTPARALQALLFHALQLFECEDIE